MPIYEFRCDNCRQEFVVLCRMGGNGKGVACPSCGKKRLHRLMSTFSARSGGARAGATASASTSSACSSCSGGDCSTCH